MGDTQPTEPPAADDAQASDADTQQPAAEPLDTGTTTTTGPDTIYHQ